MRKYLYMTRLTMMNAMQYKAFFLATFVSLAVKILVALYVWKTIFFTQSEVNGFTLQTFTTYIIFANLLASLNSFSLGEDLSYSILKGSIAGEFLRPYSFILALYFLDLSMWGLALPLVVVVLFSINYNLFRYGMTKFTSVGN